jgi:KDO2-lipid IV(A) lauroyltransferase
MSRLARLAHAQVVPCVIEQDFHRNRCVVRFHPSWKDFPSTDEAADALRMNRFIEARILEQPANYLWSHKRFKTRPPGERSPYER